MILTRLPPALWLYGLNDLRPAGGIPTNQTNIQPNKQTNKLHVGMGVRRAAREGRLPAGLRGLRARRGLGRRPRGPPRRVRRAARRLRRARLSWN